MTDDIVAGLRNLYAVGSDPGVFVSRSGMRAAVNIIVSHDLEVFGDVADVSGSTVAIRVQRKELDNAPLRGEIFNMQDGTCYTISSTPQTSRYEHTVFAF